MFAVPAAASAAATNVDINNDPPVYVDQNSMTSKSVISPGDDVIWTHQNDPVLGNQRGVRFDDEASGSETCNQLGPTGSTCPRNFPSPGRFAYFDPATCANPPASACSVNGLVVVYVPP